MICSKAVYLGGKGKIGLCGKSYLLHDDGLTLRLIEWLESLAEQKESQIFIVDSEKNMVAGIAHFPP